MRVNGNCTQRIYIRLYILDGNRIEGGQQLSSLYKKFSSYRREIDFVFSKEQLRMLIYHQL